MAVEDSARSGNSALRVAVVGGGPAGTFFAYCLLEQARRLDFPVEVTIFEPKKFERRGAFHCNYCQGVISAGLLAAMEKIGLAIPRQVIQAEIKSYLLVTLGGELKLPVPGNQRIYTVFRGHGPHPERAGAISFDQFLLDRALAGGARKLDVSVREVSITPGAANPVVLVDHTLKSHWADVVVGAYGVNSRIGEQFEKLGFGYRRPETSSAFQAELRTGDDSFPGEQGGEIKIFALGLYPIRFAVITPKRGHLTVSLIGDNLHPEHIDRFLSHPLVRAHLPVDLELVTPRCSCAPQLPVGDGKELAAGHCLIIGDAGVSRFYKNGIESALHSAELAAGVLARYGAADAGPLRRHYGKRVLRLFRLDNALGQVLFRMHDWINRLPSMARAHLDIARGDFGLYGHSRRQLRWILWNMFTGDAPYKNIFLHCLDPILLSRILLSTVRTHFITRGSASGREGSRDR